MNRYSRDLISTISYLAFLRPSLEPIQARPSTSHLGVLLADVTLQAGLNYETVVVPRLNRIVKLFAETNNLQSLTLTIREIGVPAYLDMRNKRKSAVFERLLALLQEWNLDTCLAVREACRNEAFRDRLRGIPGVGPKTVDYLCLLTGYATVPIDRHMVRVLQAAGVCTGDYEYASRLLREAMLLLDDNPRGFEHAVWSLAKSCAA